MNGMRGAAVAVPVPVGEVDASPKSTAEVVVKGLPFAVPVSALVVIAVIAGFLGLLAALLPAWRASRMNVLEAINTE